MQVVAEGRTMSDTTDSMAWCDEEALHEEWRRQQRDQRQQANGPDDELDPLFGIDPRALEGQPVPARRFVVTPWIPMGRATGLYGAGGVGKTTLMQMLCTATALNPAKFPNANWLGLPGAEVPVDPAFLRRRCKRDACTPGRDQPRLRLQLR
jgi:hypothetical protein